MSKFQSEDSSREGYGSRSLPVERSQAPAVVRPDGYTRWTLCGVQHVWIIGGESSSARSRRSGRPGLHDRPTSVARGVSWEGLSTSSRSG